MSKNKKTEDAFGDLQTEVQGQEVRRGSKVRVTVKIIHDDGKPTVEADGRVVPASRRAGHYVIVSVSSAVKPGIEKNGELEFNANSAAEMRKRVNTLAGALAEMLCEKYGDTIDPGECAKAASEAWSDTLAAVERL